MLRRVAVWVLTRATQRNIPEDGILRPLICFPPGSYLSHSELSWSGIYVTDHSLRGRQVSEAHGMVWTSGKTLPWERQWRKLLSRKVLHVQADICFASLLTSVAMVSAVTEDIQHAQVIFFMTKLWNISQDKSSLICLPVGLSKCRCLKSLRLLLSHK
jgi:hypothetical protein